MIREVDLKEYLPDVVSGIYELKELAETENRELNELFQACDDRFYDSFILNTSLQGLKRYESMLEIPVNSGAPIEERRRNILMKWNRQLPYTMSRLIEQLALWAGAEGFFVSTERLGDYILEICLINKTLPLLRNVKESVEQMIPANLVLNFSGLLPSEVTISVKYENRLTFLTEFYPRYNIAHHYLEGAHYLEGRRSLNGYASDEVLDFYPVKLDIGAEILQLTELSAELSLYDEINVKSEHDTGLLIRGEITEVVRAAAEMEYAFECRVFAKADCNLTVEDRLRYLDGNGHLDGENVLSSDIYYYHL